MKREEYKGQFDHLDTPAGMWENIEKGLDDKKKKKRGVIWWRVAASVAVIIGLGVLFTQMGDPVDKETKLAHNGINQKRNAKPGTPADTTQKMGAETGYEDTLQNGTIDIEYTIEEKPQDQIELNGGYGGTITTAVPFMAISPDPRSGVTANYSVAGGNYDVNLATVQNTYTFAAPVTNGIVSTNSAQISHTVTTNKKNDVMVTVNKEGHAFTSAPAGSDRNVTNYFANGDVKEPITLNVVGQIGNKIKMDGSGNGPDPEFTQFYGNSNEAGITDGVYVKEHIPTKREIPFEHLREANDLWVVEKETFNRSRYDAFAENSFLSVNDDPLSTFSIDVDGASYSDVRGMINRQELPNPDAVRIEEFVNYFPYDYEEPTGEHPFSIQSEVGDCPWNPDHQLMKVAIKGQSIEKENLPTNNLVFLIDVSGSMRSPEKLEIIKKGFRLLVNELREEDHVSICVYASASGVVLPPTSGENKDRILDAIMNLSAGGSTSGGAGIKLAYSLASENFDKNGNNRIILATDGDFNVGITGDEALVELIEEKRESGVFLTVLGVGHDNYQSSKMEKLANNGNGNFSYIDNILEAKKVLVTEMGATLQTIAKDVKIQMEFNPNLVSSYRLIGYENRLLQNQDFANDAIDAGELGAGHTVTAIYEIVPFGVNDTVVLQSDLKYSDAKYSGNGNYPNEMATMKFRYKEPDGEVSKLIEKAISSNDDGNDVSADFRFTQAVIEFGLILRQSQHMASSNFESVMNNASKGMGNDPYGYRREFMTLVEKTQLLWGEQRVY